MVLSPEPQIIESSVNRNMGRVMSVFVMGAHGAIVGREDVQDDLDALFPPHR